MLRPRSCGGRGPLTRSYVILHELTPRLAKAYMAVFALYSYWRVLSFKHLLGDAPRSKDAVSVETYAHGAQLYLILKSCPSQQVALEYYHGI